MGMIVVDASVAAKWVLVENGSHLAEQLLVGTDSLVAPALIRIEVAGAITRAHRKAEISEQKARAALAAWYEVLESNRLWLIPDDELLFDAIELAISARHPLADCLYAAVAKRFDAPLMTADTPMIDRLTAVLPRITPLVE